MTDQTETPAPAGGLQVFTCINRLHPTRSCYGLVEDADEPRRLHREWHASLVSKEEGQRKAIKDRDDEIANLHNAIGEYQKASEEALRVAEGFRTEISRVEAPAPVIPLTINRAGYSDEELEGEPDEPDDDWDLPIPAATVPAEEDATAGEPAESGADDLDDEPDASARTSWSR